MFTHLILILVTGLQYSTAFGFDYRQRQEIANQIKNQDILYTLDNVSNIKKSEPTEHLVIWLTGGGGAKDDKIAKGRKNLEHILGESIYLKVFVPSGGRSLPVVGTLNRHYIMDDIEVIVEYVNNLPEELKGMNLSIMISSAANLPFKKDILNRLNRDIGMVMFIQPAYPVAKLEYPLTSAMANVMPPSKNTNPTIYENKIKISINYLQGMSENIKEEVFSGGAATFKDPDSIKINGVVIMGQNKFIKGRSEKKELWDEHVRILPPSETLAATFIKRVKEARLPGHSEKEIISIAKSILVEQKKNNGFFELQRQLHWLNAYEGPIDGKYTEELRRNVISFKKTFKKAVIIGRRTISPITDFVDRETRIELGKYFNNRDKFKGKKDRKEINVTKMQEGLRFYGYYFGFIDGVYNDETMVAIKQFQKENKLKSSVIPNNKTLNKLIVPNKIGRIMIIKENLKETGFYNGKINGLMEEAAKEALIKFQKVYKLQETGETNFNTVGKLALSSRLSRSKGHSGLIGIEGIRIAIHVSNGDKSSTPFDTNQRKDISPQGNFWYKVKRPYWKKSVSVLDGVEMPISTIIKEVTIKAKKLGIKSGESIVLGGNTGSQKLHEVAFALEANGYKVVIVNTAGLGFNESLMKIAKSASQINAQIGVLVEARNSECTNPKGYCEDTDIVEDESEDELKGQSDRFHNVHSLSEILVFRKGCISNPEQCFQPDVINLPFGGECIINPEKCLGSVTSDEPPNPQLPDYSGDDGSQKCPPDCPGGSDSSNDTVNLDIKRQPEYRPAWTGMQHYSVESNSSMEEYNRKAVNGGRSSSLGPLISK